MNKFIITTDCQRGKLSTRCTFAELAIQLENGGHKVTALARASEADYETCGWFDYAKIEAPPAPCWEYSFSSGDPAVNGKRIVATSYQEAAAQLGCKVQFAIPFSAHCSAPNGRVTVISWGLDPVE